MPHVLSSDTSLLSEHFLFGSSKTDEFRLTEVKPLGELQQLRIGHQTRDHATGWFVENISVVDDVTAEHWVFECNNWLDSTTADGLTCRELTPTRCTLEPPSSASVVQYFSF